MIDISIITILTVLHSSDATAMTEGYPGQDKNKLPNMVTALAYVYGAKFYMDDQKPWSVYFGPDGREYNECMWRISLLIHCYFLAPSHIKRLAVVQEKEFEARLLDRERMEKDRLKAERDRAVESARKNPESSFYYNPSAAAALRKSSTAPTAFRPFPGRTNTIKRTAPTIDLTSPPSASEEDAIIREVEELRRQKACRASNYSISPTAGSSVSPRSDQHTRESNSPCPTPTTGTGDTRSSTYSEGMSSSYVANAKRPRFTGKSSTGSTWTVATDRASTSGVHSGGYSSASTPSSSSAAPTPPTPKAPAASSSTQVRLREIQDLVHAGDHETIELPEALYFYMKTHNFSERSQHIISVLLSLSDEVDEFCASGMVSNLTDEECEFMWYLYVH